MTTYQQLLLGPCRHSLRYGAIAYSLLLGYKFATHDNGADHLRRVRTALDRVVSE